MDSYLVRLANGLGVVLFDAEKQLAKFKELLAGKTFANWTREKHEEYFKGRIEETEKAIIYLHARLRQIEPD